MVFPILNDPGARPRKGTIPGFSRSYIRMSGRRSLLISPTSTPNGVIGGVNTFQGERLSGVLSTTMATLRSDRSIKRRSLTWSPLTSSSRTESNRNGAVCSRYDTAVAAESNFPIVMEVDSLFQRTMVAAGGGVSRTPWSKLPGRGNAWYNPKGASCVWLEDCEVTIHHEKKAAARNCDERCTTSGGVRTNIQPRLPEFASSTSNGTFTGVSGASSEVGDVVLRRHNAAFAPGSRA